VAATVRAWLHRSWSSWPAVTLTTSEREAMVGAYADPRDRASPAMAHQGI
jgi:hypothetical protein